MAWYGFAWSDVLMSNRLWSGVVLFGFVCGMVRCCMVLNGMVWFDVFVWSGVVLCCLGWSLMVWCGLVVSGVV